MDTGTWVTTLFTIVVGALVSALILGARRLFTLTIDSAINRRLGGNGGIYDRLKELETRMDLMFGGSVSELPAARRRREAIRKRREGADDDGD